MYKREKIYIKRKKTFTITFRKMKSFVGDEIVSKRNENSHIQTHMLVHLDVQAV